MTSPISIQEYLRQETKFPLIDVRTPAEFAQGHVPGAFNIPLFTNEERVQVGTTYKQQSREDAILLGFDLTGAKWSGFIREALQISPDKKVAVHCWRGGMRSGAMAWAFDLYGFDVQVIKGGYKSYRRWALQQFKTLRRLTILGGMTGSGKTDLLKEVNKLNEQVIDLEDLAQHQGSAYGTLGHMVQPTQEQFENDLALALAKTDPGKPLWLEDESLTIGRRFIPKPLWEQMRTAPMIDLKVPLEKRVIKLAIEYGSLDKDFLKEATTRIWKRLGPEQTKQAIAAIDEGRMDDFVRIVLVYYDKTYKKGLTLRDQASVFSFYAEDAEQLIDFSEQIWKQQLATI